MGSRPCTCKALAYARTAGAQCGLLTSFRRLLCQCAIFSLCVRLPVTDCCGSRFLLALTAHSDHVLYDITSHRPSVPSKAALKAAIPAMPPLRWMMLQVTMQLRDSSRHRLKHCAAQKC